MEIGDTVYSWLINNKLKQHKFFFNSSLSFFPLLASTMDQTCPNMLHNPHSRHVWMHRHVLIWFPAGKAPASRSPTMSSRCHPLRGCEGEGEWKLAPRARAATAPRARFEALTSDRNPSTGDSPATPPRASRRRGLPLPCQRTSKGPRPDAHLLARSFLHLVNRATCLGLRVVSWQDAR